MQIAVISDSHDHIPNLRHALAQIEQRGISAIFHCGDLISPFVTRELGKFKGQVHTVFGNNDADRFLAQKVAAKEAPNVTHHGEFGFVEIEGHKIGFTHYKEYAWGFAGSGQCDVAFFGHTHVHFADRINGKLVLNPGELLGLMGKPSFCVYDLKTGEFERIIFEHQPW